MSLRKRRTNGSHGAAVCISSLLCYSRIRQTEVASFWNYLMKTRILTLSLLAAFSVIAQTNQPVVEDFKPSSLNQPGKQYPQVNSERRVRARVVAPQAQSVMLDIGAVKY